MAILATPRILFDRIDWHPGDLTSLHLNLSTARSWFQVPNTYDQHAAGQDQRQHMTSFNVGLGISHALSPALLAAGNTWVRQDRVNYFPSANLFADQPATLSQSRRLTSTGFRTDLTYSRNRHTLKGGVQFHVTPLFEAFSIGLTKPAFNSPCADSNGTPVADSSLVSTSQCAPSGFTTNASYQPALLPYDLTRLFDFHGAATIYEGSGYVQDSVKLGQFNLNLGVRYDHYDGLMVEAEEGVSIVPGCVRTLHSDRVRFYLSPMKSGLNLWQRGRKRMPRPCCVLSSIS